MKRSLYTVVVLLSMILSPLAYHLKGRRRLKDTTDQIKLHPILF